MHPIERLRYVARAGVAPDKVLVAESVPALAAFAPNSGALLVALRQLIARQPESPGLVVLGATMLNSLDPVAAAWTLVDALEADLTNDHADRTAVDEAGGIDLIETIASGSGEFVCPLGSRPWLEDAHARGRTVAAVTPLGSRLPRMLWTGFLGRITPVANFEVLEANSFDEVVGPDGAQPPMTWGPDCPDTAELASF